MVTLLSFSDRIWLLPGDETRLYGIPVSTRSTIVRLRSGGLWMHSPVLPTENHFDVVATLGVVEHIVAPNKVQGAGIERWRTRYPNAQVWLSPAFRHRHPDVSGCTILELDERPEWRGEIDFHLFGGSAFLDEMIFLHRPSRTLIVADLIQKHNPKTQSFFWLAAKHALGVLGQRGGTAYDLRATFIDRKAARDSRDHVMSWDFENLILCHGQCSIGGGRSAVSRALSWL